MKLKKAFTLAEVLITLGIIGVVAALTMPSLIAKNQEKVTVTKLKKTYSIMSQAILMATNENGPLSEWGLEETEQGVTDALTKIAPYLKIVKDCKTQGEGCFPNLSYKQFGGADSVNFVTDKTRYNVILADGTLVSFLVFPERDGFYGGFYVDVNGKQGPNQAGYDMFQFVFEKTGVKPGMGISDMKENLEQCVESGYSCTSWVIVNENLDYIRCPDELIAGATKCK